MKKPLHRCIKALPWLLLLVATSYFVFFGGWKDATLGRLHRKAAELFSRTDEVTEAQIYLLMGEDSAKQDKTFSLRPYGTEEPIFGSIVLKGDELQKFLELWRFQELSYYRQAMCHHPPYGFRLYSGDSLVGETSICWECSNFYVTAYPGMSGWYGFIADGENGKALLEFCDARLPYKRHIEKEPKLSAPIPSGVSALPSPLDKLQYLARRQQNYVLEFVAKPDEERFQIIRWPSSKYKRETFIMRFGKESPDGMFLINSQQGSGSAAVPSDLWITYLPDGRSVKLVKRVREVIPTYFGQFKLAVDPKEDFFVKKGNTFRLSIDLETEYRLLDLDSRRAIISYKNKEWKEVKFKIKMKE